MRENYQKILEETIARHSREGVRPRLLLHACCAPCSSYVLEYLSSLFEITLFFYNPNIFPHTEYERRKNELIRPVVANVDKVIIVTSLVEPDLNLHLMALTYTPSSKLPESLLIK